MAVAGVLHVALAGTGPTSLDSLNKICTCIFSLLNHHRSVPEPLL